MRVSSSYLIMIEREILVYKANEGNTTNLLAKKWMGQLAGQFFLINSQYKLVEEIALGINGGCLFV